MKNSLAIVQEVLHWLEKYSGEQPQEDADLKSFILWLNSRLFDDDQTHTAVHDSKVLDMQLSFLLVMLHKHYKSYSKKVLRESELSSPESYSFLFHLNLVDSYRKMELINMHLLEPPSGIEVIKRLLRKDLIEEFDDPDDKRARRIKITEKGRKEIDINTPKMQEVFRAMTAEMSLNEKLHVVSFLEKMNQYHTAKSKEFNI